MANYVEVNNEGKTNESTNESELIVWLRDNNLNEAIPILQKENISFNELLSMGEDVSFLKQCLIDLHIPKSLSTKITFKINQILKNRDNEEKKQDNMAQPPIIRVVVSAEEDSAINELK